MGVERTQRGHAAMAESDPEPDLNTTGRPLAGCKYNPDYQPLIRYNVVRGPTTWGSDAIRSTTST